MEELRKGAVRIALSRGLNREQGANNLGFRHVDIEQTVLGAPSHGFVVQSGYDPCLRE